MRNHITFFCCILWVILHHSVTLAQSEAVLGQPFGIGCIVLPISPNELSPSRGLEDIQIYEQSNRILYPVFEVREAPRELTQAFQNARRPIGRLVGEILDQTGTSLAVYFLFTGDRTPLNVTIVTNRLVDKTVIPAQQPTRYNQLLHEWWSKYNKDTDDFAKSGDPPPVVKEYLRTMLASRLGLQRPAVKPPIWDGWLYTELGFQLDPTAALFDAQAKRFFEPQQFSQPLRYDLPPALGKMIQDSGFRLPTSGVESESQVPPPKPEVESPKPAGDTKPSLWETLTQTFAHATAGASDATQPLATRNSQLVTPTGIEPLAFHVPAHCFYIRFGSYSNFTWLQDTIALWGGDMRNLIALRALNTHSGERLEQQIGLRQDALAKLFGDSVIDDIAVIGTDLFFDEGAAFGLLFRAKNNTILANDFNAKRREYLRQHRAVGAVEQTLDVKGHAISAITSPDHSIRTFYVAMGDYHLVTRSEQLARDFVVLHVPMPELQMHKPLSLGELTEFQQVREIMPVEDKATVFLYFSRPYFYNITSPGYWIETQRRATAAADIALLRLGGMAAAAEGYGSLADVRPWGQLLRTGGYVPQNFGSLPDGSETILASWKDIRNTQRGERGSFVPIADMLPKKVTEAEYHAYETMCRDFFENWGNLDPVIVSIKRTPAPSREGKTEHIVIDARMAPMSGKNRETLQTQLGQPLANAMTPIPGNFASFEVSLNGNFFFGGLQNEIPAPVQGEQVRPLQQLATDIISGLVLKDQQALVDDLLAGYLGYIGQPGQWLKTWDIAFLQRDDTNGYSRGIGGTWRRHFGQYTLYARQRSVIDRVAPQLGFVPADYTAHLRVTVGNPLTAQTTPALNHLGFLRTCDTSRASLKLLNDLQTQFHINGQDCKEVAEQILGGELICPLGGQYVYQPYGNPTFGMGHWHATALDTTVPGNGQNATSSAFFERGSDSQPTTEEAALHPTTRLAPPLNWFRGGKLDALLSPDAVSIHAEMDMLLPEPSNP